METHADSDTNETRPHRSRLTLNMGMQELKTIIPELDSAERAMLTGVLGDALIELVGLNGSFYAGVGTTVYKMRLFPVEQIDLAAALDNDAQKAYNGNVAEKTRP